MTTPKDVLQFASREIGYTEWPPGSNLNKYGSWYGVNGVQWCAIFVSYCFYNVGLPIAAATKKGFSYCPDGVNWFKSQGRFFSTPQVGDVVFYDWYKNSPACKPTDTANCSDAWHVGIVKTVNSDGTITAIEGNTEIGNEGNGGKVMERIRHPKVWYGFGRPLYSAVSNPPLPVEYPQWPGRYITLTSPYTQGDDVRIWKKRMTERGWNLGAGGDNVFDKRSYEVLTTFQSEKGFAVDGLLGPISWNAAWELPVT